MITPALSVLSAVEGLEVAAPQPRRLRHLPLTVVILLRALPGPVARHGQGRGLLRADHRASGSSCIGIAGIVAHRRQPGRACWRFNPIYGIVFLAQPRLHRPCHARRGLPGGDRRRGALRRPRPFRAQADPGGLARPRAAGAGPQLSSARARWCSRDPDALENPFFLMFPDWARLPMVVLATAATVIASQAVITGAYSLSRQAIQLGLLPRLEIRHTSESPVRPDLHAAGQRVPAPRRAPRSSASSARRARSPAPTASRSPARWW